MPICVRRRSSLAMVLPMKTVFHTFCFTPSLIRKIALRSSGLSPSSRVMRAPLKPLP